MNNKLLTTLIIVVLLVSTSLYFSFENYYTIQTITKNNDNSGNSNSGNNGNNGNGNNNNNNNNGNNGSNDQSSSTPSPTPMGFIGNAEQASITNVVLTDVAGNGQATVTIQNTGSTSVTITSATIDGNTATMNPPSSTVYSGNSGTITITSADIFVNTAQYTINLTTANGNTITCTATYTGP